MAAEGVVVGYAPGYESLSGITPSLDTTATPGNVSNAAMIWLNETESGSPGANDRPANATAAIAALTPLVNSGALASNAIVNVNCETPHHNDLSSSMAYNASATQISNWEASRDSWIAVLQGVKAEFPQMKVGIWGLPYVPAAPARMSAEAPASPGSWAIPILVEQGAYGSTQAAKLANEEAYIEEMIDRLVPVIEESDYIDSRVYPNYGYRDDGERGGALTWPPVANNNDYGRSRDQAFLKAVLRIGSGLKRRTGKPHYACMKPSWTSHDLYAAYWVDELITDGLWAGIVDDVCAHGVDGVYVWWSYRLLDYAFSAAPTTVAQSGQFADVSVRELFRLSWVDARGATPTLDITDESYWTSASNKAAAYELVANKIADRMALTVQAARRANFRHAAKQTTLTSLLGARA
jgi:hypothetical protein